MYYRLEFWRVERDDKIRLTPVLCMPGESLTTGTTLLLCGCVRESETGAAQCILDWILPTYFNGVGRVVT